MMPPGGTSRELGRYWSDPRPVVTGLIDGGAVVATLGVVVPGDAGALPSGGVGLPPGGGAAPGPRESAALVSSITRPVPGHSLAPTGMTSPPVDCAGATFTVTDGGGTNRPTVAWATPDSAS